MPIPLVVYLGAAAEAAPLVAALGARRAIRGGRRWVVLWCATLIAFDLVALVLALSKIRNLWLAYVLDPLSGALVLWTLSYWQGGELPRLTMRLAIVPLVLFWTVLTLAFDNTSTFSRAAAPMTYLVCLGASAYTLVTSSLQSNVELWRQDWAWISAGMALYFGMSAMMGPLAALLVRGAPSLLNRAIEIKSLFLIAAFLAVARGVACPNST